MKRLSPVRSHACCVAAFLALLLCRGVLLGADAESWGTPSEKLPAHIPAPEGKLTFYADFANAGDGKVPLYVVNRTGEPVQLPSDDGYVFTGKQRHIRLETQTTENTWERADIVFPPEGAFCGTVMFEDALLRSLKYRVSAGHFRTYQGYMPTDGIPAKVRYAFGPEKALVTNEGPGRISPKEQEGARRRELEERPGLLGSYLQPNFFSHPGEYFSRALGEWKAAFRLLRVYEDNPYYDEVALEVAAKLETAQYAGKDFRPVARDIRSLLARPGPKVRDAAALFNRCVEAIRQKPGTGGFGTPEAFPARARAIIRDLAMRGEITDRGQWKIIAEMMEKEPPDPRALTVFAGLAPEFFPASKLEALLYSRDGNTRREAISALSTLQRWQELSHLAWTLSPTDQCAALAALAYPKYDPELKGLPDLAPLTPRNPIAGTESAFWKYCTETYPLEAARELLPRANLIHHHAAYADPRPALSNALHGPLCAFLLDVAERSSAAAPYPIRDAELSIGAAIELLATWRLPEDREVLDKLRKHNGYRIPRVSQTGREYPIREAAERALEKFDSKRELPGGFPGG